MNIQQKKLVENNLNLVHYTIHTFFPDVETSGHLYDECYAQGCEALCRAASAYDESRGVQFSSFAVIVIKNSLINMFKKENTCIIEKDIMSGEESATDTSYDDILFNMFISSFEDKINKKGLDIIKRLYYGDEPTLIRKKMNIKSSDYKNWLHRARKLIQRNLC